MAQDIDGALREWPYRPDLVQARLIAASDGRPILQLRVELGVLQLEVSGRPDGTRPHGHDTYLDFLQEMVRLSGERFTLSEEHCREVDREFMQYYQRRICWLSLRQYTKAVADADHTLGLMDLVKAHSPSEEFMVAHEQYRGFVVFHRTQALATELTDQGRFEEAVNALRSGLTTLREFFVSFGLEDRMDEDGMVQQLRRMEKNLRENHKIGHTLEELLAEAVAAERYEEAARIRDAIRQRDQRS